MKRIDDSVPENQEEENNDGSPESKAFRVLIYAIKMVVQAFVQAIKTRVIAGVFFSYP